MMNTDPQSDGAASPPAVHIRLDPDVSFVTREVGGATRVVAHHHGLDRFFQFGAEEYRVVCLIDGRRGVGDIAEQVRQEGLQWTARDVADFIAALVQQRIAITEKPPSPPGGADSPDSSAAHSGEDDSSSTDSAASPPVDFPARLLPVMKMMSGILCQRIPLLHADPIARRLNRKLGWLFSPAGVAGWCLSVALALTVILTHQQEFSRELQRLFEPGLWPILLVMWCLSKVVHEAGHATAARRQGVRVGRTGVMFFMFAPLAYVDVTNAWALKRRWSRVQIALAGVYIECGVAAAAALLWWWLPTGWIKHMAAQLFILAGPTTLLVNANPLLRLDGYYVLSDWADIPNLRSHGRQQLLGKLEWWLFGIAPPKSLLSGWRRPLATWHAFASVIFQFVWMTGLVIAVSMWAKGLGVLLGIIAALLWGVLPLSRWVHKIWTIEPSIGQRRRLVTLGMIAASVLQIVATSASPFQRRVPVVVRFHDQQVVRAPTDAFVRSIYVSSGARVTAGVVLLQLENVELQMRRDKTADELALAQRREIQLRRQGKLGLAEASRQNAASLSRRLVELNQQLEGLRVVAQRPGIVVTPQLDRLQDQHVKAGEELLRVGDPQEKELLVSISEDDMQAYEQAIRRASAAGVRLRGGEYLETVPGTLQPTAQQELPHPALSAAAGGPLAVQPAGDSGDPQMLQPRMQSITRLSPAISARVRAGQRGTMSISDNRTLIDRLSDAFWPRRQDS